MSHHSSLYSSGSEPPSPEVPTKLTPTSYPVTTASTSTASSHASFPPRRRTRAYAAPDLFSAAPLKPRASSPRLLPPVLAALAALLLLTLITPGPLAIPASSAPFMPVPEPVSAPQRRMSNADVVRDVRRWKDPAYAHANLKVFYYDLPARFNADLVRESHENPPPIRDPHCDESFYSAEHTIAEYFRTGPVRTMDADEADYFYVPVYTTCYLMTHLPNDVHKTGAFFQTAMDHVIQEYPYWNRSDGRDHLMMFAQGFGARLAGDWQQFRHATFLVHNGDYEEDHFDVHKDLVVPPDLRHYLTPVGLSHPTTLVRKTNFVLFGGQILNTSIADHRGSNYSGGVRQFIQSDLSGRDGYKVTGVRSTTYVKDMAESVFCLAPHGWHKWSPRPAYAVLLGCIPVVISEMQQLFLGHLLDYTRLAVWSRPNEVRALDGKLRSISADELMRREVALRQVWPLFWYGRDGLGHEALVYSLRRKLAAAAPRTVYV